MLGYYRYCVGGVDCGGRRRRQNEWYFGGYPRYGHNTIDIHRAKILASDSPQYRQALKYDGGGYSETAVG